VTDVVVLAGMPGEVEENLNQQPPTEWEDDPGCNEFVFVRKPGKSAE
jgi:hypothetical protein